ncbi:PREDICTED: cGMP-dependent 3',5'-cyclic phosphodiesterase-like isoform X1 [Polistes dominula]|uniref:Phosphodiesterase n=1 Tax=Polistes dominula TaxID=743375 RepID=A0ABM1IP51_POLDO|nr:PREDICTED: cGMP-dependent 3',5'-cyclic phosphodiesterase-like isoform X1 [Polistes dominula]
MDSFNLKSTDPNTILSLIEELSDLSYAEIQLKLNTYIQTKTGTKLCFLASILYERKETVIHVIGNKILDQELRLPISNILNKIIDSPKTIMASSSELTKELLQHIYLLDKHYIDEPFLLIPVQHHDHHDHHHHHHRRHDPKQLTALVVCIIGCENKTTSIETCTKIVVECFRYCLGYVLSSLRCYEETRLKHQCQNILAISRKLITRLGDLTDLLREIMTEVRNLTKAERCSLFLLENDQQELVAYVFDGISIKEFVKEMRISVSKGIAGHVAMTGQLLNIKDAYEHPLFYKGIDEATGFKTKNILCFPIRDENGIVGVAQLCNKIGGLYFDDFDEEIATAVSIYCGITIMHSIVYKKMKDAQARNKLSNEVMMYHMKVEDEAVFELLNWKVKDNISDFGEFHFSPRDISYEDMSCCMIKIFSDLNFIQYFKIKMNTLARFILYVKKAYRHAPYHNWVHAFSVAHFAYLLIKNLNLIKDNYLTYLQAYVFLVSCLCHDIDHRGTNNAFQTTSDTVLASLYSSEGSVMERHHFAQTMCILNTEGCNIFEHFTSQQYREALGFLKSNILATDLASHLRDIKKQSEMIKNGYKNDDTKNQKLLCGMLMTCCDLSDQTKDWTITKKTAELIYEEFFSQGDLERSMGKTPIEMMDRNKAFIPDLQVEFITDIVVPVFTNLAMLFPMAKSFVDNLKHNKNLWEASKKVFEKYAENGIQGMKVLLDPNFETEVFHIYCKNGQENTNVVPC